MQSRFYILLLLFPPVSLVGKNWAPLSKLTLHVPLSSQPLQGKECQSAFIKVHLSVLNATMPSCSSVTSSQLCFVDMNLSFQIKENKPPGAFHQLQLLAVQYQCQNLSISYKMIAGKPALQP